MSSYDPQVMIRYSIDGGHTWSNEIWRSLGIAGDYRKKIILNRIPATEQLVLELTMSDNRSFTIIEAFADIEAAM